MLRLLFSIRPAALVLAGLLLAPSPANAQLKLPKRKVKGNTGSSLPVLKRSKEKKPVRNGVVPHLVCSTCGEHNYQAPMDRPQPDGSYLGFCRKCARDTAHQRNVAVADASRLHLPSGRSGSAPRANNGNAVSSTGNTGLLRYGNPAASFIVSELRGIKDIKGPGLQKAVEALIGLGEEGLVISRIALHDSVPAVSLTAGRVLIRGGMDQDAARVVARLRIKMPGKSGPLLLEELVNRNPVHGSPELLVDLLDHEQKTVRNKAVRLLEDRITPELLPQLREVLTSRRSDTRLAVIRLVEELADPAVLEILLDHLDDRSSRVSDVVIKALARRTDERLDLDLLARALNGQWILREHAFAILAIVEREDDQLSPILGDRHAELLLGGLRSRDALIHGACAAALAGIGFRSSDPGSTEWLDREVTGTMVSSISGQRYHSDFMVMQPRVLSRLRLLTGEDFGTEGPGWARWWVANRPTFYARRAFLKIPRDGESKLEVYFRGNGTEGGSFSLFGSQAWSRQGGTRGAGGEKLLLNRRECLDMLALLEREGTLGPERPSGVRGSLGFGQRELEIVIDGHGKTFVFGAGHTAPWFDKIISAMGDLRARNRWQRYRTGQSHDETFAFWQEESGWWAGKHDELARDLRLKHLIFESVKSMPPSGRRLALSELGNLYGTPGVAGAEDFERLLDLLRDEGFFTERASELVDLAIQSASVQADGTPGALNRELGSQLIDLLIARFSTNALSAMGRVAAASGRDYIEEMTISKKPMLRAVAAAQLSNNPSQRERLLLIEMLDDSEPVVQASAASALGVAKVEEARTELLLRARIAQPMVRAAALRAVGQLGGDYVLEALVLGVANSDLEIKRGAAEGLAILGDPQSASLLISLLRQGRGSDIFETAHKGLVGLGENARADLRRTVSSPAHSARLECALLLSRMLDGWVASPLISLVEQHPDNRQLMFELAVLTCVDYRRDTDPAIAWREWYNGVTHGDARVWFAAALERKGIVIPPGTNFTAGVGAREGGLILLELLGGDQDYLAERARRDLSTMLGADLGKIPFGMQQRAAWLFTLRETILERFES